MKARPPSPPLYTPFYFVSGTLVRFIDVPAITPNAITIAWMILMAASATALAVNQRLLALFFLIISITLDCLDGDLARLRTKESAAGSLLEPVGRWWGNSAIVAGGGIEVSWRFGLAAGVPLLVVLCISQALYLAVVTDVQALNLITTPPSVLALRLLRSIRIQYKLMPIELPL